MTLYGMKRLHHSTTIQHNILYGFGAHPDSIESTPVVYANIDEHTDTE